VLTAGLVSLCTVVAMVEEAPMTYELRSKAIIMNSRYKYQPTAENERANFVRLWLSGMSIRVIARASHTSVSTVYRWIRRWLQDGNVNTKLHNPRSRKNH
ncbi:putative helix-turn-helix HTH_28 domain containing protein 2, partial [Homarus americanus]